MPIYEFICKKCHIIQEEEHSMKDAPSEAVCLDCGKAIKRYYSDCNFTLKGGGWPSKNLRAGQSAIASNAFEADQIQRKKNGQKVYDKEVPMSDEEYKRRRKNIERFIDETPKK